MNQLPSVKLLQCPVEKTATKHVLEREEAKDGTVTYWYVCGCGTPVLAKVADSENGSWDATW